MVATETYAGLLIVAGLLVLGVAMWLWLGLAATLGYAGTVLILLGAALATERKGAKP